MKAGYARVDARLDNKAAGKLRKIRCNCTGDGLLSNSKDKKEAWFFNLGETGHPGGICPVCHTFEWYTV